MSKDKKTQKMDKEENQKVSDQPENDQGEKSEKSESAHGDKKDVDTNYKIIATDKKDGVVSLEIELPFSELESKRKKAIEILGKDVEIRGFRKGAAPARMVEDEIGEGKIIEEMSYQAIVSSLPSIVVDEKINALTQPKISITKLAPGNPLVFKADFVLMPEVDVADYKKIAKEIPAAEKVEVTDAEIDEYIDYIRSSRAEAEALKKKTSADPKEREEANKKTDDDSKENEEKIKSDKNADEKKDKKDDEDQVKKPETELPELNDEFVKTLGDFKNVEDFKTQLKENMKKDKEQKNAQKRRLEIIEKIISDSKIDIPELMIEEELQRMLQQFKGDLEQAKMNFEDYLAQINKKEEDLMKEWRPDAIKRTKMNLILPKIAMEEKIEADPEKVEHEVKHLKQHYPDVEDAHAKSYVSHMLRNDEVFKFLEEIK